jgi:endonuclease/exonuclease/phosphatase family metal-dependent hydrolase
VKRRTFLVLAGGSILAPALAVRAAPRRRPETIRVMSFNIRYGTADDGDNAWPHRRALLFETIAAFDPDLLGTQETVAFQGAELRERFPDLEFVGAGRTDGAERGKKTAVLFRRERFEKLDEGHFWLSETPEAPGSKSWDSALPRMVTWVRLRERGEGAPEFLFFNTHFDHRGTRARLEGARLLRRRIDSIRAGAAAIVTGDFNCEAAADSPPYAALTAPAEQPPAPGAPPERALSDAYRMRHPARAADEGTFNGFEGRRDGARIDWILVTPDVAVIDAAIDHTARDGRYPSDHFPVTATVRLPP